MLEKVQISIICSAFNHEKYIRQCLDGFVMQKGVTFEIIIHDDASTDKTADIIREYEQKHPYLFKSIYQTENQYSKGIDRVKEYMVPLITGKYVAECEGDDYWTDPYKLKKQYDALESNPDCYMCLHKVRVVNEDNSDNGRYYPLCSIESGKITSDEFYSIYNKAGYYQTSCYFFLSQKYIEWRLDPPKFRLVAPTGDDPTLLYFSFLGNVFYISEIMSHYRFQSTGSWTNEFYCNNTIKSLLKQENYYKQFIEMLREFSLFSDSKYDTELSFMVDYMSRMLYFSQDDIYWFCLNNRDYPSLFEHFGIKELHKRGLSNKALIKMKLQICFPFLF